jgi:mono/diheme cytochrome c family protein
MSWRRRLGLGVVAALGLLIALAGLVAWLNLRGEAPLDPAAPGVATSAELVARGEALTRAGDCTGCHTARGGRFLAGGRAIETPFGNVFASNLTPGRRHRPRPLVSRRVLARAPPRPFEERAAPLSGVPVSELHPHLARRCRRDVRVPAEHSRGGRAQPRAHAGIPFGTQAALAVWRALYFRPAEHVDDPARSAEWNRGAYLVEGLGHCNACHSARNALGATRGTLDLQGGLIPVQNWYAPSLASPREASVAGWPKQEVVQLLKTGIAPQGFVMGPMSDVVLNSTQHLSDADIAAMATYLQALPRRPSASRSPRRRPGRARAARRSTRTIASPATASAARACRGRIRRWPAAGR